MSQNGRMSSDSGLPPRRASRGRPPTVPPIVHEGVRYEQMMNPTLEELPPGGYLKATDVASGQTLWKARVYETILDPTRETDVQIVFFRSMGLGKGDTLLVENERGRKFEVALADGAARPLD